MAIAAESTLGNSTSVSANTLSLTNKTVSGTDRLLLVAVSGGLQSSGVTVTSITYGGEALTQLGTYFNYASDGFRCSLWYKIAPKTDANQTLSVTISSTTYIAISAVNYTGVDQSTPFTTPTTTSDASSPAALTDTSDRDGSWQIAFIGGTNGSIAVSSGGTTRQTHWAGYYLQTDSNATVANGVSNTLNFTYSGGGLGMSAMMRPVVASASNVKSADGVLQAKIKSADGLAIANIKNSSGVSNV